MMILSKYSNIETLVSYVKKSLDAWQLINVLLKLYYIIKKNTGQRFLRTNICFNAKSIDKIMMYRHIFWL